MLKYKDFLLLSSVFTLVACAPQRATFTLPSSKDSTHGASRSGRKTIAPPDELELKMPEGTKASLQELVTQLDDNAALHPTVGMYRAIKRKNPVTKRIESRRQEVTEVTDGKVKVRTTDLESGTSFPPRDLDTNEMDPLEKGLRKLAEGDAGALYSAIAAYLALYYNLDSIPQKSHVLIDVKSAMFIDHLTFKLNLKAKLVDNTKQPGLAFEARIVPQLPRPFNIVYLAWGPSVANQPVLEITDFGPIKPEGLTLGNATPVQPPAPAPAPQEMQVTPALVEPPRAPSTAPLTAIP